MNNNLGDKGIRPIGKYVMTTRTTGVSNLALLDLSDNQITGYGFSNIFDWLKHNSDIKTLILDSNYVSQPITTFPVYCQENI